MAVAQPDTLVRPPVATAPRSGTATTPEAAGQDPTAVDFLSLLGSLSAAPVVAATALPTLTAPPELSVKTADPAVDAPPAGDPAALQVAMAQWLAAMQSPAAVPVPTPAATPPETVSAAPLQAALVPVLAAATAAANLPAPAAPAPAAASAVAAAPAASLQDSAWAGLLQPTGEGLGQGAGQGDPGQGEGSDAGQARQGLLAGLGLTALAAPDAGSQPPAFSTALQAQSLTTASTATATPDPALAPRLHETVGGERWANELGSRLTVMAAKGDQSGSLRLSPEHLGPLEVQIKVTDDQVSVQFGATHADTRSALQEALPRLRELFAGSGLQLSDAGVSRETPRQTPPPVDPRTASSSASAELTTVSLDLRSQPTLRHLGLLDTYA